jgi:hypothetical protein
MGKPADNQRWLCPPFRIGAVGRANVLRRMTLVPRCSSILIDWISMILFFLLSRLAVVCGTREHNIQYFEARARFQAYMPPHAE